MNVKEGDLAIQIKSAAGNEGRIVTVGKFLGRHEYFDGPYENCWFVKFQGWAHIRTKQGIIKDSTDSGIIPDSWLKPISGLPDDVDVDTEVPVAA